MTIPCHVKDGRPNNAKKLNEAFKSFEGKDVIVTIEKRKSKRSEQQNKYYWGCVIMDETFEIIETLLQFGNRRRNIEGIAGAGATNPVL